VRRPGLSNLVSTETANPERTVSQPPAEGPQPGRSGSFPGRRGRGARADPPASNPEDSQGCFTRELAGEDAESTTERPWDF